MLKNAGIQDEKIIKTVVGIIDTNNRMVHTHVERMISEALEQRLK